MTFNQFQKELRDLGIEGKEAYLFTLIYERLTETDNQLATCASLIASLAETMQSFVQLNEAQQRNLKLVLRGGRPNGIEVESVVNKPEDD